MSSVERLGTKSFSPAPQPGSPHEPLGVNLERPQSCSGFYRVNAKTQRRKGAKKKEPVGRWHLEFENILKAALTLWPAWAESQGTESNDKYFLKPWNSLPQSVFPLRLCAFAPLR